jgi:KaiC/GvpD/RAD55 family RecA-like ATPase
VDLRPSTGIDGLDELLGGGLLLGRLTAVVGSTGIGKTQFGLQFIRRLPPNLEIGRGMGRP